VAKYQAGEFRAAKAVFAELTARDSKAGAPWVLLGLSEFELREYAAAAVHLERGRALGFPDRLGLSDSARFAHAGCYLKTGRYEYALHQLYAFADAGNPSKEVLRAMGLAVLRKNLLAEEAEAALTREDLWMVDRVGEAEWEGWRRNAAFVTKTYGELLRERPNEPWLRLGYASQLIGMGEWEKAALEFEGEIRIAKASVQARIGLAYLATIGEYRLEAGLRCAGEAIALDSKSVVARLYRGRLLSMDGKPAEAAVELERAKALSPESARVRYALAQAYHQAGRIAEGEREMAEFQRLKPAQDAFRQSGRLPSSVFLGERDESKN
jgi:predicted Zn-dependent protease